MPVLTQLYPTAVRSSPAYTDWTNTTVAAVSANLVSPMTAPAAVRDSAFEFFNPSWAADTVINYIGGYVTARYTGPDVLYFGGSPPAMTIELWLDESTDVLISSTVVNKPSIQRNTWNHYALSTVTARPDGTPLTKTDFTNLYCVVRSEAYPASYQLEVAAVALSVDYNQPSTIAGTAPNTTVTTATPTFTVTHTDADGEVATAYRARIVKLKDIASYDNSWNVFNDASTPMVYDSGVVPMSIASGGSINVVPPEPLDNFTEYRCYVQTQAGGIWSQPLKTNSYAYAITKFPQPSAPDITSVIPEDDENNIIVLMTQRENQAGPNQSDQISSLADWTSKVNCTLSRYTTGGGTAKYDGIVGPVLDILGTTAADFSIGTSDVAPAWDVTSADQWSASIMVTPVGFAGSAGTELARRARMDIYWYTAANALVSISQGRENYIVVGEWINAHCTAKKPATATKATVRVQFIGATAASERYYASSFQIKQGPLNLSRDPLLRIDTDGNGLADILTSYRFPGSGGAPVYSLDSVPPADALFGEDTVQKIAIPAGNADTWVGFRESFRLSRGSVYTVHAWVYSDRDINTDWYIDTVYPNVTWPRKIIPANTLTHIQRTFVTRDTVGLSHIYYRFGGIGGLATNIWVAATMVEPADIASISRVSNAFGGFESGVGTFINVTNAQLNQQTPESAQDTYSLRVRSIAAGDVTFAATSTGTNGYAVMPGAKAYCAVLAYSASPRALEMYAYWYQAGGAASAVRASELVDTKNESLGAGSYMTLGEKVFDVPSDAAYCQIRVVIKATTVANEVHLFDTFQFIAGNPITGLFNPEFFTLGGFTSSARYLELQKSQADGVWETVSGIPPIDETPSGSSFVNLAAMDYFQEPDQEVWYRVRARSTDTYGSVAYSVWSEIFRSEGLAALAKVWLKSVSDPTKNMMINLTDWKIPFTKQKQRTTHMPLGADKPVVISGRRKSVNFPFNIYCQTEEIFEQVIELLDRDEALLLQLPKRQLWVNLAGDYVENQFTRDKDGDTDDTVISGIFQEVRAPI